MGEIDIVGALLLAGLIPLGAWFYPHCVRPALADASANARAFQVAIALLVAVEGIYVLELIADLGLWELPTLPLGLWGAALVLWGALSLAFLRPGWYARLAGPRDPTAYVRFLMTWFRSKWSEAQTESERSGLIRSAIRELERIRGAENAAAVDQWLLALATYARQTQFGTASASRS